MKDFLHILDILALESFLRNKMMSFLKMILSLIEYPKTTKCVEMIKEYIEYRFQVEISNAEKGYLMIHINNILRNKIVTK
ncbi:PRD domain-containing protein [Clostridium rhizosphaerae]